MLGRKLSVKTKPDGEWEYMIEVSDWRGRTVVIAEDDNGDIGILDSTDGCSITLSPPSAVELMVWLAEFARRQICRNEGSCR
jgi:hypothetical protein